MIHFMKEAFKISELIAKRIKGTISQKENIALDQWVNESPANKALYDQANTNEHLLEKLEVYSKIDKDQAWLEIQSLITEDKKIVPLQRLVLRYAAVIVPFLILAFSAYYYLNNLDNEQESVVVQTIEPGTEKATLVLADGSRIELERDDSPKEIIMDDIKIDNSFQMLKYSEIESQKAPVFHELITPKGGKYGIMLPDGTEVLLNAGSSLRYPTAFQGENRKIFLSGEAFLKVKRNVEMPFIVECNDMDVAVLGTTFNFEAYEDESIFRTTLIEGKVKVSAEGHEDQILDPEDQAVLHLDNGELNKIKVNTSQFTSWIEGKFEFANDNLETVMKKLSRWYDFEYTFENPEARNFHFSARIDDKQDISTILDMLEMTTSVKFEIRDKNEIVIL